jgi:hypothetical protein
MDATLEYFATQGPITSPGTQAGRLEDLPTGLEALCRVVQGLMLHIFWAEHYGDQLSAERRGEVQLRSVAQKLERIAELDPRPLSVARPPEKRLVGNCRDFTVLLSAILRHQGIPARARCGFARYFIPNHYEDHWVCEVWQAAAQRWVLVDAQLDALQIGKLGLAFDPLDVPRDQFIAGGPAWQLCRAGQADPETFGIADMHGLWFVRGDFVRDVAALNKVELLPWDVWGLMETGDADLSADDLAVLDHLAALTSHAVPDFAAVRRRYETDSRFRVPASIRSYTPDGPQTVVLDLAAPAL